MFHRTTSSAAVATAPATTASGDPHYSKRYVITIFLSLAIAMFTASFAETMTATALPTIVGDLGGVELMQWVTTAFIMASTITMLIYGKLGDLMGRKFLIMSALGIYLIGSVICAITPTMEFLIVGRFVSGMGGGGLMILSQAIIADVVPARQIGKYLGFIGAVFSVSTVLGPILGGWFVQVPGWRWMFAFNVPLAAIAIICIGIFLKTPMHKLTAPLDVKGIIFMVLAVTGLVLTVSWGGTVYAWDSVQVIGAAVVCVVAAILLVLSERKAKEPILPLYMFKDRNFNIVTISGLLIMAGQMGTVTYLPTYFQIVNGLSPELAGLMSVPRVIGLMITSVSTGFIASKTGKYKWMTIACGVVVTISFYLMSLVTVNTTLFVIGLYLFIMGFGNGLGQQIYVLIVQNEFSHAIVGTATAGNNFFRQIGSTLGSSFVGTLFTTRLTADISSKLPADAHLDIANITPEELGHLAKPVREVIVNGYCDALIPVFLIFVPIIAVTIVLCCFIQEHPLATTIDHGAANPQCEAPSASSGPSAGAGTGPSAGQSAPSDAESGSRPIAAG